MRRRQDYLSVLAASIVLVVPAFSLHVIQANELPSRYVGAWTLNRDLTDPGRSPDGGGRGDAPGRGRGSAPGHGGGPHGGGFGGRGGRGAPVDHDEMQRVAGLMGEVMTPTPHFVLTIGEQGTLTLTDAVGRSMTFVPNGKLEKHQLTNGTIDTKTRWDDGELRQEIQLSDQMKLLRTYSVDSDSGRLVVSTRMNEGSGRGGTREPRKFIYDADARSEP